MKKMIFVLVALCLSFQAYADTGSKRKSTVWLDREYQVEITSAPSTAKLISTNSYYLPDERDCNDLKPEHCSTIMKFNLGTITISILSNGTEVGKTTTDLIASGYFDSAAVNHNCNPKAACNVNVNAYLAEPISVTLVNDGNHTIEVNFSLIADNSIVTLDNTGKVQSSTAFKIRHGRASGDINDSPFHRECDFLNEKQWAAEQNRKSVSVDPEQY